MTRCMETDLFYRVGQFIMHACGQFLLAGQGSSDAGSRWGNLAPTGSFFPNHVVYIKREKKIECAADFHGVY